MGLLPGMAGPALEAAEGLATSGNKHRANPQSRPTMKSAQRQQYSAASFFSSFFFGTAATDRPPSTASTTSTASRRRSRCTRRSGRIRTTCSTKKKRLRFIHLATGVALVFDPAVRLVPALGAGEPERLEALATLVGPRRVLRVVVPEAEPESRDVNWLQHRNNTHQSASDENGPQASKSRHMLWGAENRIACGEMIKRDVELRIYRTPPPTTTPTPPIQPPIPTPTTRCPKMISTKTPKTILYSEVVVLLELGHPAVGLGLVMSAAVWDWAAVAEIQTGRRGARLCRGCGASVLPHMDVEHPGVQQLFVACVAAATPGTTTREKVTIAYPRLQLEYGEIPGLAGCPEGASAV